MTYRRQKSHSLLYLPEKEESQGGDGGSANVIVDIRNLDKLNQFKHPSDVKM